jgi:tetratricopeptide (TPR) repeat protein
MARAAAKRRQTPRPETSTSRPKGGGGGESYESNLFFSRLRRQAKWVFVLLALVFGGGFVVFGVGSDIGGGLSDIFQDNSGGGNTPSISKALEETQARPKDPAAWRALAEAYETEGTKNDEAIDAWTRFTQLRPKLVDGYSHLSALYETKANRQTDEARLAQYEVLSAQPSTFLPPTSSPLGRALAERPDPISQAIAARANERYNTAIEARQTTLLKLVNVYTQLAKLQPDEPSTQLQLATSAQNAGDAQTAIQAWRQFLVLAPDAPEAPYAKQQIKALEQQLGQG